MPIGIENVLKDVDMQIVYRRLEARKRDITADGKMSKRQLAMAYRGYHGLESQYHALQHLSNDVMLNAKLRNDNIQNRHADEMRALIEQERNSRKENEKALQAMREDFTAQIAYQYVSKNHSFKRNFQSRNQTARKPRPVSDNPQLYAQEIERRQQSSRGGSRPLGSLREVDKYKDELKFPPIRPSETSGGKEALSPRVNMMGGKTYQEMKNRNPEEDDAEKKLSSFPNIENAMGVEIRYKYKPNEDEKSSMISAPPGNMDAETIIDSYFSPSPSGLVALDMGQNLVQLRRAERERYETQRRQLPATPGPKNKILLVARKTAESKEAWRRVLPDTPVRPSTVFPGNARNSVEIHRLMKKEATSVLDQWANNNKRVEAVELAKERYRQEMTEHPLPTFDPRRPTSAILREYKEYKRQEEERKAAAALQREYTTTNDASVIIRQISPQPRPASPVSQRRADFIKRVQTPASKHRDRDMSDVSALPPRAGKLRRAESEKFPSVSRTTSFKELPEHELLELQENALLTAAERIQLEKNKRDAENKPPPKPKPETSDPVAESLPKPRDERDEKKRGKRGRRRLPPTPHPAVAQEVEIGDDHVIANVQLFTNALLRVDTDVDMINKVKLANVDDDEVAGKTTMSQKTGDAKHDESGASYMPLIKQKSAPGISGVPFSEEKVHRLNISSTLPSKDMLPKVSKRMEFSYENFTRLPSDTAKKRLELKARQKRKIQQKNAQLEEERRQRLQTANAPTKPKGADERPPTRVSFNENVIVFQTI
ncbi:uncharacterized protein LOC127832528 [Dreissena polymorpha]|uniref:Uncharacterized protein n=1 Tax=Dreissena polymorpha TaxID=45954 RepID=A0A9D4H627_DREPO|nr:uncharacterized protein LOC127832528 [Dreissena polymorpha]KAH3828180.1 hypothetical protein DPMN_130132 [Dreissena polymorpha]